DEERLVADVAPAGPALLRRARTDRVDLIDRTCRLVCGKQTDRPVQVVLREADRHYGQREHALAEPVEVIDRALQVRAVVPARAEHDLRVHLDPGLRERRQLLDDLTAARYTEQTLAHVRLRRVHADVQRREALLDQSREPLRAEVRQRDVAAIREREAEIVVLEVQRPARAVRIAVDEAEDALVRALTHAVRRGDD